MAAADRGVSAHPPLPRLPALDAARGVGVLAMVGWHAADAWLAPEARAAPAFEGVRAIGGLAAPFFLLLAGAGLALSAPARVDRGWTLAALRRGARIVLTGLALAVFSWGVDHGALLEPTLLPALALAVSSLALLASACTETPRQGCARAVRAAAGLAAGAGALASIPASAAGAARALLLRPDVLPCIGVSLIACALAFRAMARMSGDARAFSLATLAAIVAVASVAAIGAPQRALPALAAAWIARAEPWSAHSGGGFPLLPWAAYPLAGAALATWLRAGGAPCAGRWALPRVHRPALALILALIIALLAAESLPIGRALVAEAPLLSSFVRLARNTALLAATSLGIALAGARIERVLEALALLGRHSLAVYAVHLEIAYGWMGIPLQRALGWGSYVASALALSAAMLPLAHALERVGGRPRGNKALPSGPASGASRWRAGR